MCPLQHRGGGSGDRRGAAASGDAAGAAASGDAAGVSGAVDALDASSAALVRATISALASARAARDGERAQAQRVVEVRRVHRRAIAWPKPTQPRRRIARTAPRPRERAVAGAVLQTERVKAVVQRAHVRRARRCAQRGVVGALPLGGRARRARAVHRARGLGRAHDVGPLRRHLVKRLSAPGAQRGDDPRRRRAVVAAESSWSSRSRPVVILAGSTVVAVE